MLDVEFLDQIKAYAHKFNAHLVAVSKTQPIDKILTAYSHGQRIFGENKVQDLCQKFEALPKDIEWHMIGHLQTNKVKYIAPFVKLIHGVDSQKLLVEINKRAKEQDRIIDCLLQFHIAQEETKFGFDLPQAQTMLESPQFKSLQNIRICGIMGMASFTENKNTITTEFKTLKAIFEQLKASYFSNVAYFSEISMGMSSDYEIALQQGSTLIRIGSKIFGQRT